MILNLHVLFYSNFFYYIQDETLKKTILNELDITLNEGDNYYNYRNQKYDSVSKKYVYNE